MIDDPQNIIVSTVDMQKALCMPKMPTNDYYFSRKLVLFIETFASPGKNAPATCILWHEGEAGRKKSSFTQTGPCFLLYPWL